MKSIVESVSNRELAFLIWMSLGLLLVISKASVREATANILRMIFWSKLTLFFMAVAAYTAGMVYVLQRVGLWDLSQIKNTVLWFFTAGAASLFHITDKNKSNYLRAAIKDVISITAVLQFLVGVYSFNLAIELVLVPLAFLIGGTMIVAEQKAEHQPVARLIRKLLAFGGLFLFCYTLIKIIIDFKSFANQGTLNDFVIPAAFSFLFLPMLYLLSIIVTHDDVFTGIEGRIKHPGLQRYAKWKALIHFHANKKDINRWRRLLFLNPIQSKSDVDKSIERIREMKRKEKLSVSVEFNIGWSPYAAMKFLQSEGISTGYYQPAINEDEWISNSDYVKLEGIGGSNIAYYVEGNETTAEKLTLTLNVYDKQDSTRALGRFMEVAELLHTRAVPQPICKRLRNTLSMGKNLETVVGNRKISLYKEVWEGHKRGGYSLSMKIEVQTT